MSKNAIKKGYFQGATEESVDGKIVSNNPEKLGYPKEVGYSHTELNPPVGDVRAWEQKAFESAATDTKKNLGPSGAEFKLKQDLQRIPSDARVANAQVSVGFTRTASPAGSFWTVYIKEGDKEKAPVLRASLSQIWGKELNKENALKSATPEYGKAVLAKINKLGFSKVAYLLTGDKTFVKKAGLMGAVGEILGDDELEMVEEAPAGDDLDLDADTEVALDAEVDQTAAEGEVTVDLLEEKVNEVEQAQTNLVEQTAPESTADVFVELQDAEKMLNEAKEEMQAVASKLRSKKLTASQKVKLIKIAQEAQDDAVETLSGSDDVLSKAQEAISAADSAIEASEELAGGEATEVAEVASDAPVTEEIMIEEEPALDEAEPAGDEGFEIGASAVSHVKAFLKNRDEARKKATAMGETEGYEQGKYGVHPDGAPKDGKGEIDAAHPKGGTALTNVNVGGKPAAEGEVFETVTEAQEKDLKATNKMPTGDLNSKASASKGTVKTAAADSAAKQYFEKDLYGQGDAASKQFGKDLTKDFAAGGNETGKAVAAAIEETQAKVVRAYEVAEVATEKGFCDRTAAAKSALVKEILAFDDSAFMAFKKMLDKAPVTSAVKNEFVKTASVKVPRLGQLETSAHEDSESAFISKLTNFNWSR